jgi:hypothetical protein
LDSVLDTIIALMASLIVQSALPFKEFNGTLFLIESLSWPFINGAIQAFLLGADEPDEERDEEKKAGVKEDRDKRWNSWCLMLSIVLLLELSIDSHTKKRLDNQKRIPWA